MWSFETIVDTVTNSYLEAAVWSSLDHNIVDEHGNSPDLSERYRISDFTDESYDKAKADCKRFLELLKATPCDGCTDLYEAAIWMTCESEVGHDFWLTRNGHGAGFWDGDYDEYGDAICEVLYAEFGRYNEFNIWADVSGKLHLEG